MHLLSGDVLTLGADPSVGGADPPEGAGYDAVVLLAQGDARPLGERAAGACAVLRPGGRLVVVADNALALGALAGGCADRGAGATTRAALAALLAGLGLAHRDWWFAFPGGRAPLTLIAERGLARPGGFDPGVLAAEAAPEPDRRGAGSLRRTWTRVAEAGLLADLAPAFAVAASAAPLPPDPRLAVHLGLTRQPGFGRTATFAADPDGGIRVTRTPRDPGLPARIAGVANLFPGEGYVPGRTWQARLGDILAGDGWRLDAVSAWAVPWRDAVSAVFADGAALSPGTPLPARALDAIARNLIFAAGPVFIDLEWDLGRPLDAGHLALRAVVNALVEAGASAPPRGPAPSLLEALHAVLPALGLAMDAAALAERLERESRFQSIVSGRRIVRDLNWAAATRPALPDAGALLGPTEGERLRRENAALHAALAAERSARAEAEAEGTRRTDRLVAYAAGLDRARDDLRGALDAALAEAARREAGRAGARLRRLAGRLLPGRA